jgi:hypothetical protein
VKRISSKATFIHKRVFPALWFGFLLIFLVVPILTGARANSPPSLPFFIVPILMMVFGYFMMKKLVFDLVDEVWDDGDSLVVKNRGEEQRIALDDIKNVNYSPFMNPPRVVLSLRQPNVLGDQIAFCAPQRFIPFGRSPIIDELIDRIDAARQRGR